MSADKKLVMKYLRIAAENGLAEAMYQMGWHYGTGTFVRKNIAKSIAWFRKAARKSDELAFYDLGLCYDLGKGVRQSDRLACKFYSKAALCGHVAAMCNLGAVLANYDGSQRDGILWTRRAALRGDDKAQHNLGEWYANGECGLKKSCRLALKWLKMSAGNGNILAREVVKAVVFRRGPSSTLAV